MTGSPEGSLPPCDCFTVLESRGGATITHCDVCDQIEAAHETPGRRLLSGAEIEALRRRMLIQRYDKREDDRRTGGGDGRR